MVDYSSPAPGAACPRAVQPNSQASGGADSSQRRLLEGPTPAARTETSEGMSLGPLPGVRGGVALPVDEPTPGEAPEWDWAKLHADSQRGMAASASRETHDDEMGTEDGKDNSAMDMGIIGIMEPSADDLI